MFCETGMAGMPEETSSEISYIPIETEWIFWVRMSNTVICQSLIISLENEILTVIFLFCMYMLEKTISRSMSRQLFCQKAVNFTMLLHSCAELFCIFFGPEEHFFFFFFFSQRTFALEEMIHWDLRVVAFQVAFLICKTQVLGVLEWKTESILQAVVFEGSWKSIALICRDVTLFVELFF